MRVTPISRSVKANALTNPNPSYVSMVKAGANQKPFRAVRMDEAVPAEDEPTGGAPMKIKHKAQASAAAIAPTGYGVMQFEFSKEKFADEAAVKAWMDAGGYSDYEIVTTSKGFEISDSAEKFEAGSVRKIDGAVEGMSVFVGKLSVPLGDDGEPEVQPTGDGTPAGSEDATGAAKAAAGDPPAEPVRAEVVPAPPARQRAAEPAPVPPVEVPAVLAARADEPAATIPAAPTSAVNDEPAAAVVEAIAGEGAEPGAAPPVEQTVEEKAQAIIVKGQEIKTKGVYETAALGSIISELGWIVYEADYSGLSDETINTIKAAALSLLTAFMQAAEDAATTLTEAFKTAKERQAAEPAPTTAPAPDTAAIAALIERSVATAIAPLTDRLTTAETTATEATQRAVTAEAELAERVAADASRGQTRKGAEEPLEPVSTDKSTKERSQTSTNILRSFGSRHARQKAAAL